MARAVFDTEAFVAAMEPGVVSYVVQALEAKLELEFNAVVERVFRELHKELPKEIEAKILHAFEFRSQTDFVKVEVNFTGLPRKTEEESVNG